MLPADCILSNSSYHQFQPCIVGTTVASVLQMKVRVNDAGEEIKSRDQLGRNGNGQEK